MVIHRLIVDEKRTHIDNLLSQITREIEPLIITRRTDVQNRPQQKGINKN